MEVALALPYVPSPATYCVEFYELPLNLKIVASPIGSGRTSKLVVTGFNRKNGDSSVEVDGKMGDIHVGDEVVGIHGLYYPNKKELVTALKLVSQETHLERPLTIIFERKVEKRDTFVNSSLYRDSMDAPRPFELFAESMKDFDVDYVSLHRQ